MVFFLSKGLSRNMIRACLSKYIIFVYIFALMKTIYNKDIFLYTYKLRKSEYRDKSGLVWLK